VTQSGQLLLLLAVHLVLTALPGVAAVLLAAPRGISSESVLLAIGLTASGLVATLAFWAFYADPLVGESFAYLIVFGSVLLVGWSLRRGGLDGALLRRLATPFALWALGSAFLVLLGFLHGGMADPSATSSIRFSHPLPADNLLPRHFADWFFEYGHRGTPPPMGDWLSSDRPPLQIGYVLSQRPFGWDDTGLRYQVLGVVLQQLWIVGLWALLLAARVGRITRALVIITVLVGDIAIVNGFFVWPKMLPAAMLLAAAALVATPLWADLRRSVWGAALVGALLALAMLGHGASLFGVIPLLLVAAYRGFPGWRWVGVGLMVGLALMAPWSAYQRYGDPPGDRLTKWMLGGVEAIDDRSTTAAILDSYGEVGLGGALANKAQNFGTMAGTELNVMPEIVDAFGYAASGELDQAVRHLRSPRFFSLAPLLGLFLVVPFVMLAFRGRGRKHSDDWQFALICLALAGLGVLSWGLLLFGPPAARTTIHVGSLALPILALCGAVAGLRATFPRFAIALVCANAIATLTLYVPALDPPTGSSYSALAAVLAAVSLTAFVTVALRAGGHSHSLLPFGSRDR
jgi:hypothetical protein